MGGQRRTSFTLGSAGVSCFQRLPGASSFTCGVGSLRLCCGAGYQEAGQVDSEMNAQTSIKLESLCSRERQQPRAPYGWNKVNGQANQRRYLKCLLQSCWGTPCFSTQKIVRAFTERLIQDSPAKISPFLSELKIPSHKQGMVVGTELEIRFAEILKKKISIVFENRV